MDAGNVRWGARHLDPDLPVSKPQDWGCLGDSIRNATSAKRVPHSVCLFFLSVWGVMCTQAPFVLFTARCTRSSLSTSLPSLTWLAAPAGHCPSPPSRSLHPRAVIFLFCEKRFSDQMPAVVIIMQASTPSHLPSKLWAEAKWSHGCLNHLQRLT